MRYYERDEVNHAWNDARFDRKIERLWEKKHDRLRFRTELFEIGRHFAASRKGRRNNHVTDELESV